MRDCEITGIENERPTVGNNSLITGKMKNKMTTIGIKSGNEGIEREGGRRKRRIVFRTVFSKKEFDFGVITGGGKNPRRTKTVMCGK
jgi:hypothetical protein